MIKALLIAASVAMAGCSTIPEAAVQSQQGSMVEDIKAEDTERLVQATVSLLKKSADPSDPVIGLSKAADTGFTPALIDAMKTAGFQVNPGNRMIYQVGPVGDNLMVRVTIDGRDSTRMFSRSKDGALVSAGPIMVTGHGEPE